MLDARQYTGRFGVNLFFIISGFLITEGLLQNIHYPTKLVLCTFYFKRILRIFPIYYLLLLLAIIFHPPFRDMALYAFTYTVNLLPDVAGMGKEYRAYIHLWSLSIEEQYYLVWPLLLLMIRKPAGLYIIAVSLLLLLPAYSGLCIGSLMGIIKWHTRFYSRYQHVVSVMLLAISATCYALHYNIVLQLCLATTIVYFATTNGYKGIAARLLQNKAVTYCGKISYGIYLYHLPLYVLLNTTFLNPLWQQWYATDFSFLAALRYNIWIPMFAVHSTAVIIVAHLSYKYIESPFLKLKNNSFR